MPAQAAVSNRYDQTMNLLKALATDSSVMLLTVASALSRFIV